jgi:hypothetical protein
MFDRRHFLSTTFLAGVGALVAGPALALTVREATPAEAEAYVAACRARLTDHDQLVREVLALLDGQNLNEDKKQEILRTLTCPLCGCALASS